MRSLHEYRLVAHTHRVRANPRPKAAPWEVSALSTNQRSGRIPERRSRAGYATIRTGTHRGRSPDMEEPRKLYRSRSQRMIAGVCGGLADYFNIDATLVRVLFLLLAVFGGTGLVIYVVMWVIVPDISKV